VRFCPNRRVGEFRPDCIVWRKTYAVRCAQVGARCELSVRVGGGSGVWPRETMSQARKVSEYIVAWGLWAFTSALGVLIGFWAVRDAINAIAAAMTMGALQGTSAQQFQAPLVRGAIDRFSVLVLGVLSVLLVVAVEHYYRTGVEQRQLLKRLVLVTAIESGVLFVALAIQAIYLGVLGLFTVWSVLVPCGVLAVTVALSWVLTRMPNNPCPA